jgi:hypothetical protein
MKTKNISILLFLLVFAGIILLGYSQVQAELNLGDGICSELENQLNFCISIGPDPDNPCYVIEALDCDGAWPCSETIAGVEYAAFRYRATANAPCNCPTWSYSVTQYQICDGSTSVDYVMDSSPSGASLFRCKVSKCDDINPDAACFFDNVEDTSAAILCDEDFQNWKLNPTLNCSEGGSIDFVVYTLPGTGVSCGNPTYIRTRDGCQNTVNGCTIEPYLGDVLLRGPGCDPLSITVTSFQLGEFSADLDPCTGQPLAAFIGTNEATEVLTWFSSSDTGCNPADVYPDTCPEVIPLSNTGPTTGCVFKSNPSRGCIGSRCFR